MVTVTFQIIAFGRVVCVHAVVSAMLASCNSFVTIIVVAAAVRSVHVAGGAAAAGGGRVIEFTLVARLQLPRCVNCQHDRLEGERCFC